MLSILQDITSYLTKQGFPFLCTPTAPQDSLGPTSKKPLPPPSKLLRCLNIRYQELYFSIWYCVLVFNEKGLCWT